MLPHGDPVPKNEARFTRKSWQKWKKLRPNGARACDTDMPML